jgi:hypothetical protein
MKNQFLKTITSSAILGFAVLFTQCGGKDDEDPKTASEYLVSSKWTLDVITSDDLDESSLGLYSILFEGYEVTYSSDGTFKGVLPAFGEFGTDEGTWELSSDEKILFHDKGTEDEEMLTIKTLNKSTLEYETILEDEDSGSSFSIVFKLKH